MRKISVPLQSFVTGGKKIVVASPMYRQVSVSWLYNWMLMDKSDCVGWVSTEGVYLPIAMTALVEMAFDKFPAWDRLVIFEDDVTPPLDALSRVSQYSDEYDIVTALHFMHEPPHRVLAFERQGDKHVCLSAEATRHIADNPGMHEVDAVPMGFTAISRRVLEQWHPGVLMWQPTVPLAGQDVHFCMEAKRQGFRVWVDSALRCGHLTELPIGYSDSEAALLSDPSDSLMV